MLKLEDIDDDDITVCALQAEMYSAYSDSCKEIQILEALKFFLNFQSVCVNLKGSLCFVFRRHS